MSAEDISRYLFDPRMHYATDTLRAALDADARTATTPTERLA